jgi:tight adherence protein B
MVLAFFAFLLGAGAIVGAFAAFTFLPGFLSSRRFERRMRDVSTPEPVLSDGGSSTVVKREQSGPLPIVDRLLAGTTIGDSLSRLIEQSGSNAAPSTIVLFSLVGGAVAFFIGGLLFRVMWMRAAVLPIGLALPFMLLLRRRTKRLYAFEEMFPEALDLMSRAIRAGHAFQTAMGMAADELRAPVGPEFKKAYEQQNYGLPLRDALHEMAGRVPILDVKFFVTAVLIQRETGGNLSEILDNLSHVVRERFKIRRQIRVHTAHGRFTGWVLLGLPAALAVALSMINPEHMQLLFREHMGQLMLMGAVVMQTVGYFWIRQVIKIEV